MPGYRIVFVCLGNICRSPMAEVVFRSLLEDAGLADRVAVSSAGTGEWHVGEGVDRRAMRALHARGYDASAHRARQFAHDWFDQHDLVLALDSANLATLRRLAPSPLATEKVRLLRSYDAEAVRRGDLDVPDPHYGGPDGFGRVLDLLERACRGLLVEVRREVAP
ncbi:MAG TPA: low molecular weight protein-tyrosine-phosphatase [Mycobacteriales bacterium]|nr:low molecular weight protein-tyrosine-phosphatase [Mycobacteriales bacterium]